MKIQTDCNYELNCSQEIGPEFEFVMNARQQRHHDLLVLKAQARNYQVLGTYVDNSTKILMQCPESHQIQISPNSFKRGHGCAICAGNSTSQSHDNLHTDAALRGYQILGLYINSSTKISMRCPQFHVIEMKPRDFRSGTGCPICYGNSPIQSEEDLYAEANSRGYQVVGKYVNSRIKIEMRCPESHVVEITPDNFKKGTNCAKCMELCPIKAKEDLYSQAALRGYQVLGEYVNSRTKIQMQCPNQHLIEIEPDTFKRGTGCAKCVGHCPIQAREDFYITATERNCRVIGTYINTSTKIQMRCPQSHLMEITPNNFKLGQNCSICYGNSPAQSEEDLHVEASLRGCQVVGTYVNSRSKIQMRCPQSHIIEITPSNFKKGHNCSICSESAGEQLLRAVLASLKFSFETQYILSSLPNRKYDFAITIENNRLLFIEWDGQQHFEYPNFFHKNQDEFFERREADIQKTQEVIILRHKIIRIDHTWLKKPITEIGTFIKDGIASSKLLIVSTPEMYTWLHERISLPLDILQQKVTSIKLVIRERQEKIPIKLVIKGITKLELNSSTSSTSNVDNDT